MATFSDNVGIKVQTAISESADLSGFGFISRLVYTCPANSYAIINAFLYAPVDGAQLTIGGLIAFVTDAGGLRKDASSGPFYVGPGQQVRIEGQAQSNEYLSISGVEFKNSPS